MQEFPILKNIAVALVVAFVGGILARYLKVSTLVGYLVAGIVISPFTPGIEGDIHTIQELADLALFFCCLEWACISRCGTCGLFG